MENGVFLWTFFEYIDEDTFFLWMQVQMWERKLYVSYWIAHFSIRDWEVVKIVC